MHKKKDDGRKKTKAKTAFTTVRNPALEHMSDYQVKSQFNMGIDSLNRMNSLLEYCNVAQIRNDVYFWYTSALTLFKEVTSYITEEEEKSLYALKDECTQAYWEYINHEKNKQSKIQAIGVSDHPPKKIFEKLFEMEAVMRKLMKKHGLLMKEAPDARRALE